MRPFEARRCFLEMSTGAATTRFWVKTAAAEAGTSLESSARSSAPVFFKPQAVAAKRNPRGRADSDRACFIRRGRCVAWARRSRKRPPILRRVREDCFDLLFPAPIHALAPSLVIRFCKFVIAARTGPKHFSRRWNFPLRELRGNRHRRAARFFLRLRVTVRSTACPGTPLRAILCQRGRVPLGTAPLCAPDSPRHRWQTKRDSTPLCEDALH